MAFCQGFCNRVFQPPAQLQDGDVYSHVGPIGLTLGLRYRYGDHAVEPNDLPTKVDEVHYSAHVFEPPP